MENRNLDGMYFRIKRGDTYQNVCLSDMTDDEREVILSDRSHEWCVHAINNLCKTIKDIGNKFNIVIEEEKYDNRN